MATPLRIVPRWSWRSWLHGAAWVGLVLLLLAAMYTLIRSPCLGVADNLDFWRVMRPAGIQHLEPITQPGRFVQCTFATAPAHLQTGFSSSALLAWLAKHLTWGLPDIRGTFDLRQMGILHLLIVVSFLIFALWNRVSPILAAIVVYVAIDPGYLLFFNSFYADPALIIATFGITFWFVLWGAPGNISHQPRSACLIRRSCVLASLVFLGSASKAQFVLLPAIVLLVLAASLCITKPRQHLRAAVVIAPLVVLAGAIPWHFARGSGPRFPWANNYHAVYAGIVPLSRAPERVFRSLEVPEQYRGMPRTDVFSSGIRPNHPIHEHLENLSRLRLAWLYVSEPSTVVRAATAIAEELSTVRTHNRGNRVRDLNHPKRSTYETAWQYSKVRGLVFGVWPMATWVALGASFAWWAASIFRGRREPALWAVLFLVLWSSSQFIVVLLGDGMVSLKQHLVGARFALDVLLVVTVCDMARCAAISTSKCLTSFRPGDSSI